MGFSDQKYTILHKLSSKIKNDTYWRFLYSILFSTKNMCALDYGIWVH